MSACVDGKGGKGISRGQARGLKVGQLTLSMGPARAQVCFLVQKVTIPSKRVILYICKHHSCN
jgi:hypothetical protein